jgi:uncharacterized protein YecT (DUF1311 family)
MSAFYRRAVPSTALSASLLLGACPEAAAIPPPPDRFLANCESPTYASDVVVCDHDELAAMDQRVAELYEPLREVFEPDGTGSLLDEAALFESQEAWFRRRSLCAFSVRHADCLRAAYEERLAVLGAIDMHRRQPSGEVLHAVCRDAPWGLAPTLIGATQRGEIILGGEAGRIRAVAVGQAPRDDWTPYLRHEADGSQLRLFPLEGLVITCQLRQPN